MAVVHYQVAYKASTKTATVQFKGDALPSGAINAGFFDHDAADTDVFYQHVQDALYQYAGIQNMQEISINLDSVYVAVTGMSFLPATVTLAPAATQQLTPTFVPVSPSNTKINWTTSNAAKATVSASGLVTAVATGSATITGTTEDGGYTDTCVVTIS